MVDTGRGEGRMRVLRVGRLLSFHFCTAQVEVGRGELSSVIMQFLFNSNAIINFSHACPNQERYTFRCTNQDV